MPEFVSGVDAIAERMYSIFLDLAFKTMQNAVERQTGLQFVPLNAGNTTQSNANNSTKGSSVPNTPLVNSGIKFSPASRSTASSSLQ